MCGFAGFLLNSPLEIQQAKLRVFAMCESIAHRGPNAEGCWINNTQNLALGHRRLSILDLSSAGSQPMSSISGRWVIVFNGEIYNHLDLRSELARSGFSFSWRGGSDTETLLAGFDAWGLEDTLRRAVGMFSLAVYEVEKKVLFLARDRFGEKPIYYGWQGRGGIRSFLFGSELKALKTHPDFSAGIDRNALSLLLKYGYIPAPYSIYEGISKLEPGSILSVSLADPRPALSKYWDAIEIASSRKLMPFTGTPTQAVDELERIARNSVRQQMMSDVPLGAFLSGGIDSSTIVALMQAQSAHPIKTFTIGFNENGFNEAVHAKAVSKHLGTDHTEMYVSPSQAIDIIPKLPSLYCEPFADSSQIPTYLVSQLAKRQVTVSLSGDAGDEMFCGYNRYKITAQFWHKIALIPAPMRVLVSKLITSISPANWDRFGCIVGEGKSYASLGDKIHKGAGVLASADLKKLYLGIISQVPNTSEWVIGGFESNTRSIDTLPLIAGFSEVEQMMLLDTIGYLPDDILVKLDRAGMGASLECRTPFLDHRIFEFAWTLPLDYKLRDGQTKWLLRQLLYRYVPKNLIERPKMGFAIPIGDWLRGPLRGWAECLLSEQRLEEEGYFHPKIIRAKWDEHLAGKRNWQSQLWTVLMFQAWLENEK